MRWILSCLVVVVAISSPAFADVISPDQSACGSKVKGDACTLDDKPGACQESSCSRRDYTDGPPGKMVNVPCTVCVPGAKPSKGTLGKNKGCSAGGPAALGSILFGVALLALARRRRATPPA